jgi:hypothetical protein
VRSVIAIPRAAQKQMPVRRVGPLTMRGLQFLRASIAGRSLG